MKNLFLFLVVTIVFIACTGGEDVNMDAQTGDILSTDIINNDGGESGICSSGEKLVLEKKSIISGANINVDFGAVKAAPASGGENGPAEKTQFDVILKSTGGAKGEIISDENGEFKVTLTDEEYNKLPEDFYILFTVTPPEGFKETVKSNQSLISFFRYKDIKEFNFQVLFNDGYIVVQPVNQLNKTIIKSKEGKKAIDAFINATTKSEVSEKSEPVPGAEIIVEQPAEGPIIYKNKIFLSSSNEQSDIIVYCPEFEVLETIKTFTDSEGYFSIKAKPGSEQTIIVTVVPAEGFTNPYLTGSMILTLPAMESEDVYDLMMTYEKFDEIAIPGGFVVVGPIEIDYKSCSLDVNPICKNKNCMMKGGIIGKCQYLYNSLTGEYQCGCSSERCNADCTGNCKQPDGKEGICHIEEITVNLDGAEILNKQCVCGPIDVGCNMDCSDNQDCINQTASQFPLCRTDMSGNSFCTQSCTNSTECKDPFSMCVKMGGDERGVCICPCVNADNVETQCNPIGLYNAHCNSVTFGVLTDCIDIDSDGGGECSLCCLDDKDCPEGLHCYDLQNPLNDKCKKACMCKEPVVSALCKECRSDSDCGSGESCVDEDNNPNTPNVCSVPCGPFGTCPTSPEYTYCDYSIGKYCICEHPEVNVDCNYVCKDDQDCITNSSGIFDTCIPDANGINRCTKDCSSVKECPSPYSMCVQVGDKSVCTCPCIHFDVDNLTCYTYGIDNTQCITKTNNSLPDCFDIDNDGLGECTNCCSSDSDCPEGLICTSVLNAKCDKVCACKEHPVADVCQKCIQDSDCPSGFVCADDDNNSNTPDVCTRLCPSIYPCPTSPVYTYCDNNVSKYCICDDSAINYCETVCKSEGDCPQGLICADDDNNSITPNICTLPCNSNNGCPSGMLCNYNANLPMPVCMCQRDLCKTCKEDIDCQNGLRCTDSDEDPLTPNVCSQSCSSDNDCPAKLHCNLNLKVCDCNTCSKLSNPKCEPNKCYNQGIFGECKWNENQCGCVTP